MRGQEVEPGGFGGRQRQRRSPLAQRADILAVHRMQHQRRQRELINHLRFIFAVTEVRDVIFMRNVRLGDNHRAGGNRLGNGAEMLDELGVARCHHEV